jgi:diketogulonate reductase-like aldo/keto reductase
MHFKYLGNTREKIPDIGIGTWKMGANPEEAKRALKAAISSGMRFVDTAEMYGTEWLVAEAVKAEKNVFVATKVSPNHFSYNDVIASCNASLRNLGLKRIDLYQLHWPNHSVPLGETMRAMEELVDAGKIRYIGVSNFTVNEFVEARDSMKRHDIVSNQAEYSLLVREPEQEMLDFCNRNRITLIAYSPFARGAIFDPKNSETVYALEAIAKAHHKTPSQVALNWLVSKKSVVAIPKASDRKHVLENAGASGWKLTKGEEAMLNGLKDSKQPLAGFFAPVLKSSGLWASAAHSIYIKKQKSPRKPRST